MKKFFSAILGAWIFFGAATVNAEVKTYEGTDEYYVLGVVEDINIARERARERAIRAEDLEGLPLIICRNNRLPTENWKIGLVKTLSRTSSQPTRSFTMRR